MPVLIFLNEIWIRDLSSSKLFVFSNEAHLNSGVRLLLDMEHVAFFTICAQLTIAFKFTSFFKLLYHCFRLVGFGQLVSDLNMKKLGGSTDLAI